MSSVEFAEAEGSALAGGLWLALLLALLAFAAWYPAHAGTTWLAIYRRGRAYRARIRSARHARRHTFTFRSPIR